MKREVKITFDEVKDFIKENIDLSVDEMIDAVEPFTMDYIKSPFGFAETDNLNDIQKCIDYIQGHFWAIATEEDGRVRRGLINRAIKREQERWTKRNAATFGRMVGRLGYLLNKAKCNEHLFIDFVEKAENDSRLLKTEYYESEWGSIDCIYKDYDDGVDALWVAWNGDETFMAGFSDGKSYESIGIDKVYELLDVLVTGE